MISFRAVKLYAYMVVFLVTLVTFIPVVLNDFLDWDDRVFVVDNVHINSLSWGTLIWMMTSLYQGMWVPLTWLSHAVDRSMWGLNPAYHHLMNAIIHSMNAALVFALFLDLMKGSEFSLQSRYAAALTGALLFALHPLRVEAVAWVSERKGLLSSIFFLSTMFFYLRYGRAVSSREAGQYYALALGFTLLALMSKSAAVTLPFVLLVLDYFPLERLKRGSRLGVLLEKLPFLVLSATALGLNTLAFRLTGEPSAYVPLHVKLMSAFYGMVFYLRQTVLPRDLLPLYQMDASLDYFGAPFIISALVVLGLTGGCVWSAFRGKRLWVSVWVYYLITLAPTMSLFMYDRYGIQDRYMYVPTLGFCLLAGLGIGRLWEKTAARPYRWSTRAALVACVLLPMVFYVFKTAQQIPIWQTSESLWTHAATKNPHSRIASVNYADLLHGAGRLGEAEIYYRRALSIEAQSEKVWYNLGLVQLNRGKPDEAIESFTESLRIRSDFGEPYLAMAKIFFSQRDYHKAMQHCERARELGADCNPEHLAQTIEGLMREGGKGR